MFAASGPSWYADKLFLRVGYVRAMVLANLDMRLVAALEDSLAVAKGPKNPYKACKVSISGSIVMVLRTYLIWACFVPQCET